MNKKQKIVFLVGFGTIVIMGLIPPWYFPGPGEALIEGSYGFIFSPPSYEGYTFAPNIDLYRLLVQWAVVIIATGGMIFILKDDNWKVQTGE
jgi:hypothetical protein